MRHAARFTAAVFLLAASVAPGWSAPRIEISPTTFDFGWAPDNAKITAEFTIVNTGSEMVPLTAVKPACGCTASNFEPDGLASNDQKKITLTFNTRGFTNQAFNKTAQVKTDLPENSYTVYLKGHVLKADNGLLPDSDGIAGFVKGDAKKKQVMITNKTPADVSLTVIQEAAGWVKVRLPKTIKAGEFAPVDISVDGSLEETRDTSITLAPAGAADQNRVTIAIRTGTPPAPYRAYSPPSATASPKAPAKPTK